MHLSICIATYRKVRHLRSVLVSIDRQTSNFGFDYEIIIVDDGSPRNEAKENRATCKQIRNCEYYYLDRPEYIGPALPRNISYKLASGDILLLQSDDVFHNGDNILALLDILTINNSVNSFVKMFYHLDFDFDNHQIKSFERSGAKLNPHPIFRLGVVWRKDIYAIGGNDEEFHKLNCEDKWLMYCLGHHLNNKLLMIDTPAYHVGHPHYFKSADDQRKQHKISRKLLEAKVTAAYAGEHPWTAKAGSWEYVPGKSWPKHSIDGQTGDFYIGETKVHR